MQFVVKYRNSNSPNDNRNDKNVFLLWHSTIVLEQCTPSIVVVVYGVIQMFVVIRVQLLEYLQQNCSNL